jgi:circadian clock protein KaiB
VPRNICATYLDGKRYSIEIIDLVKSPLLAQENQTLAIPGFVSKLAIPICKIIGDLSNTERDL